jgi:hypothetical protein
LDSIPPTGANRKALGRSSEEYPCAMNKKEIESPKLTIHFLLWISAGLLLALAAIAHFVWRIF